MYFVACDEELFEDSPDQWVSQELEGADSETRRRAAVDFVRVLSRHFEAKMTQVFGQYVQVSVWCLMVIVSCENCLFELLSLYLSLRFCQGLLFTFSLVALDKTLFLFCFFSRCSCSALHRTDPS